VTGAAGSIGGSIVTQLAADGLRVVAVDLSAERLEALADNVPGLLTVVADVSTAEGVAAAVDAAGSDLDVVCNSAGVSDGGASIEELDDDVWERVLRVNLSSVYLMCNRVTPALLARGHGVIINVASVAGLRGGRAGAAYTATKWAVVGMSQNIASSLGPDGVRCHALCPSRITGAVAMTQGVRRTERGRFRAERDAGRPPAGRPEDVAEVAAFLVDERAHHLNGLAVPIDGGWLAF